MTRGISKEVSDYELSPGCARVYVWEKPVRLAHWLLVLSLVVLSFTGYYLYNPFIIARGRTAYVMGTTRFVHLVAAWVFIAAVVLRFYWFFFGDQFARISQFIPTTRERWHDFVETGKYYSFLRWSPTPHLGHNALAGATYSVIFGLAVVEILTGLALYNNILHNKLLGFCIGWLPRLIDIRYLRETHFLIMFVFWLFFIHHMSSVLLTASEEKNGCLESIFTGYKFTSEADLRREFGDSTRIEKTPIRSVLKSPEARKIPS
jgi:Ni/Fe-hydrogenase 1 B-type cytochrome subunit